MKMIFYFLMKSAELCTSKEDPLNIEVAVLKDLICTNHNIQQDNVILIANGGQCVQDGLLSNYYCGDRENNPVFVYLRQQKRLLQPLHEENPIFRDFNQTIERMAIVGKKLTNNLMGLRDNESMSLSVFESGRKVKQLIDSSIQDQFLLVEGWNAAVANLCDSLQSIEKRIVAMTDNLSKFLKRDLEEGFGMMAQYDKRKLELQKVPLLQSLVKDGYRDGELPENLMQWVLYRDKGVSTRATVQSVVEEAHEAYCALMGLVEDDGMTVEKLRSKWGMCGTVADVIKGIQVGEELVEKCRPVQLRQCQHEDSDDEAHQEVCRDHYTSNKAYMERLNYLEGVRGHCDKLMGLIQTHKEYMENTVRQCRDVVSNAVLLDHCNNSRVQYTNLCKNYSQLIEWLNKVSCSKTDLVKNIDERKNWLMKYETSICKVDSTLFLAKENIKRVRLGCRVLEQMDTAPKVYVQGIAEIRRRQEFIDKWYDWGIRCSQLSGRLRRQDHDLRMRLSHDLDNHFMSSLFDSLHSFSLPKLGSQLLNSSKPTLPHISEDDIKLISKCLPDLTQLLDVDHINPDAFTDIEKYQSNIFRLDEPLAADFPPILQKSLSRRTNDSCVSIEDVSLMPVPEDPPTQFDELCLSVQGIQMSQKRVNAARSDEDIRSIDSMDFQLTNDKMTETGRDIVCVPRVQLDTLLSGSKDLRARTEALKWDCSQQANERATLMNQAVKLLREVNSEARVRTSADSVGSQTEAVPASGGDTNSVLVAHREFRAGQMVCFTSQLINEVIQWRMMSTDHKIHYLHDECVGAPGTSTTTERLTRRESVRVDSVDTERRTSPMTQSQVQQSPRLRPKTVVGSWQPTIVWGTFISMDEYISKKTSNRFALPVDTKFFRVKAHIDWADFS